jgi:hypothetical protein
MGRSPLPYRRLGLHLWAIPVWLGACAGPGVGTSAAGCGTQGPPSTLAALRECVRPMGFDTLEAAGDEQALTIIGNDGLSCPGTKDRARSCRYGPIARIQPESTSHRHKLSDLREGRIIAKLVLPEGETQRYDSLALVPRKPTYWWVQITEKSEGDLYKKASHYEQHKHDPYGKQDSVGVSLFISEEPAGNGLLMKRYPLYYVKHEGKFKQALARWIWDPNDEKAQGSCGQGCCR